MKKGFFVVLGIIAVLLVAGACFLLSYKLKVTNEYDNSVGELEYEKFARAVAKMEDTFVFETAEDAALAYDEVTLRHPELFWLAGQYILEDNPDGTVTVHMQYRCSMFEAKIMSIIFDIKFNYIVSKINEQKNEYMKVKYVHDYLVDYCGYNKFSDYSGTAYGCIVNGEAVCSGYADAARMLCMAAGIECGAVYGNAGGDLHEWNYVKIDGDYYMMDITWDDPSGEWSDGFRYKYFLISTGEMERDHTITNGRYIPECIGWDMESYQTAN